MQITKLAWLGTRTGSADAMVRFLRDVLGLRLEAALPGFSVLTLPDGAKVEVFDGDGDVNPHFASGPVVEFLVEDVVAAADELRRAGVEILFGPERQVGGSGPSPMRPPSHQSPPSRTRHQDNGAACSGLQSPGLWHSAPQTGRMASSSNQVSKAQPFSCRGKAVR